MDREQILNILRATQEAKATITHKNTPPTYQGAYVGMSAEQPILIFKDQRNIIEITALIDSDFEVKEKNGSTLDIIFTSRTSYSTLTPNGWSLFQSNHTGKLERLRKKYEAYNAILKKYWG